MALIVMPVTAMRKPNGQDPLHQAAEDGAEFAIACPEKMSYLAICI
jgi:hypothetical protein